MDQGYALAMDIGGSHVTAALVDLERREVLASSQAQYPVDPDASADDLLAAWSGAALQAASAQPGLIRHIGIGMPGPFEYEAGVSCLTHKFEALYDRNVGEELQARWTSSRLEGVPLYFANDAAVWALGEWWGGAGRGMGRIIGVTLGTGLGSGFISGGRILSAGDEVPPGGEVWNLPYQDGIAEDYAAGQAISRGYPDHAGLVLTAREVAARAARGDERAMSVYAELGAHLARILLPWVDHFQPEGLVVGGNIAHAWPLFDAPLKAGLPGLACLVTTHFEISSLLGGAVLGI